MTEKQSQIINAAIEIFSEKGYAATTTSEIAKKAKVAEGTIFHHYKTKKDLLLAIPDYLSSSMLTPVFLHDLTQIFDHPPDKFEVFLRAIIQNRMNFASENFTLVKVLFQEIPFQPELRVKISETIVFPLKAKFIKAIDIFKARGQIAGIPSEAVFALLFSSILGYIFARHVARLNFDWDREKETDYLVGFIMNGLCRNDDITLS